MYSFLYLLTFIVFKYLPFLYQKYVWKHLEQRQVCCSGTHLCGMSFLTRVREFMGQILLFACVSGVTFPWSKYSWHKSLTYLLATFLSQLQSFRNSSPVLSWHISGPLTSHLFDISVTIHPRRVKLIYDWKMWERHKHWSYYSLNSSQIAVLTTLCREFIWEPSIVWVLSQASFVSFGTWVAWIL